MKSGLRAMINTTGTYFYVLLAVFFLFTGTGHAASGQEAPKQDREIIQTGEDVRISFFYPVFGNSKIDRAISDWAAGSVQSFRDEISGLVHDQMYELKGTYRIVRASDRIVSVVWDVWNYTGGAHGGLDIVSFTYDLQTSELVDFDMLFGDPAAALNILSSVTHARLLEILGSMASEDMIAPGTAPELENFGNVVPVPDGVRVYFQPYQVAPWAAGVPEVEVSLQDLFSAQPRHDYWGR